MSEKQYEVWIRESGDSDSELFEGEEAQRIVDFVDANLRAAQEAVPVITGVRDTES